LKATFTEILGSKDGENKHLIGRTCKIKNLVIWDFFEADFKDEVMKAGPVVYAEKNHLGVVYVETKAAKYIFKQI
jgi:hypothetical protein